MTSTITLAADRLRMAIAPALGASVLSLECCVHDPHRGSRWLPLWRPTPAKFTRANETASYLLAPYSNRIREGRFEFEGRTHRLRRADVHALHGDVHHRPWRPIDRTPTSARFDLDSVRFPDFDFPFPFRVEVRYAIDGATVRNELVLENTGRTRMPAGLGFHPYFVRAPDGGADDARLQFHASGVYPGEPPVPMLPTDAPRAIPPAMEFSRLRPIDVVLDDCFAGWDGAARIVWERHGLAASIRASDVCRHLVVYSPAGQPFFAFEPVTHANDGFNLLARGIPGAGVVVLNPGESLTAGFTMTVEEIR